MVSIDQLSVANEGLLRGLSRALKTDEELFEVIEGIVSQRAKCDAQTSNGGRCRRDVKRVQCITGIIVPRVNECWQHEIAPRYFYSLRKQKWYQFNGGYLVI
jgi:hypothetical protein